MTTKMNPLIRTLLLKNRWIPNQCSIRGFRSKSGPCVGKPPGVAKTLDNILEEMRRKDETIHYLVDIGFPCSNVPVPAELERRNALIAKNLASKELERSSRKCTLTVPIEECYDEWLVSDGPHQIRRIAEHYGVYEHLFGDAYYYPVTVMNVSYKNFDDEYTPVYHGNTIKPKEAASTPIVAIGKKDAMHTLLLSNLDGHLNKEDGEYVHWFVGNIPNGDVSKGETIVPYLQPFPTKGTGYHRYAFVLYQHEKKIDFSKVLKQPIKLDDPETRTFNTYDFYSERQDLITPSGLSFFQTEWDSSVPKVFHEIFKMDEPRYEYDFPENYQNPQVWHPKKKPFNTYMDRFRDPKAISKEVLVDKLKTHHPFQQPEPPKRFPNLHTLTDYAGKASWIQVKAKKDRLGWGKPYNDNIDIIDPK